MDRPCSIKYLGVDCHVMNGGGDCLSLFWLFEGLDLYNSTGDGTTCQKIIKVKMVWLVEEMDKSIPKLLRQQKD